MSCFFLRLLFALPPPPLLAPPLPPLAPPPVAVVDVDVDALPALVLAAVVLVEVLPLLLLAAPFDEPVPAARLAGGLPRLRGAAVSGWGDVEAAFVTAFAIAMSLSDSDSSDSERIPTLHKEI